MIFINCGGVLDSYNSKKEAMDFFEDCIYCSEGSERERYTEIYFTVKENLKTNENCFSDGTEYVYKSNLDTSKISEKDLKRINKVFDLNLEKKSKDMEL